MANTDPENWFLNVEEVPPSRRPVYTSGNRVEALIDGKDYMQRVYDRMASMTAGDYFHLTGWRVTPTQKLLGSKSRGPGFLTQVKKLIARKVNVRAIVFYHPGSFFGIAPNQPGENMNFVRGIIKASGQAILDARYRQGVFSSHHQKTILLRSNGEDYAYVGGIDICKDRWDTSAHDSPLGRTKEFFQGWHDMSVELQGPAVTQVWNNFAERWHDPTPPHSRSLAPGGVVPPPITDQPPTPPVKGTQHVQVLRTFACKEPPYPFAPQGEQTVRLALEKAIDRAEHYIYFEDQYVWPCGLTPKLAAAAKRGVKIILLATHHYDAPGLIYYHNKIQYDFITEIQGGQPSGAASGVYPFHLQKPEFGADIYVHAKLFIIDDCFVAVGSANVNNRSLTNDSELHLAVVDGATTTSTIDGFPMTVCCFAKDLRIRLWAEHLGVSDLSLLNDPIQSIALWPDWALATPEFPQQKHHAVCHFVPEPRLENPNSIANRYMNVYTPCP